MTKPHILLFEPRLEGHHLGWLHYLAEDFLAEDFKVSLAVNYRAEAKAGIHDRLSGIVGKLSIFSVFDESGKWRGGGKTKTIAKCLEESGAGEVFLPNLDEISSNCFRLASVGILPPKILKGRLAGVYHRPRFLLFPSGGLGNRIKNAGFRRLASRHWFNKIYLVDEYLAETVNVRHPEAGFHFIPDPAEQKDFSISKETARAKLEIPPGKFVFLNYGVGARRKGLHLAVRAMLGESPESRLFLLCAGHLVKDREVFAGLEQLKKRGMAKVIDRYVSDEEEKLCLCATDAVLLPYIGHIGSSGVLSRAAAAGKMVIASDEFLIGRRVREHGLGFLFPTENTEELRKRMVQAASLSASEAERCHASLLRYARLCSREAFRKALLAPYENV